VKIIEAVQLASELMAQTLPSDVGLPRNDATAGRFLGRSVPDHDGVGKVTGSLTFADDLLPAGCLYGKLVWSGHPHAEILRVRTDAALAVLGVRAVLTAEDVPGHNGMGSLRADQPVLCRDRVRFTGDVVAAVFADTLGAAEAGARAVVVGYRPLPGVFSPAEALLPEAPVLHESGNVCKHLLHEVGDAEAAFACSALVLEGHFETPYVEHAYLEPDAAVASLDGETVVVQAPTQLPFEIRSQLAAMLDLPEDRVRVIATPLGGAFGGRMDNTVEAVAALGAFRLRRPVKVTLTREESLRVSTKRHPYVMDYRVGFSADGTINAVEAKLMSEAGPYTAASPRVIDQACIFSCGPYRVPNLRVEGWAVHTNNANSSAFRGFGINQVAVAMESLLDEGARRLGLDPFAIRLRNALELGDRTVAGEILKASVTTRATLELARDALAEEMPWIEAARAQGRRIGVGVATAFKNVGAGKGKLDDAGAIFTLRADGRIRLCASAVDMGQGIRTALLQIAGEVLDQSPDTFELVTADTALTIKHGGAVGERQVLISGRAVEVAARKFRDRLLDQAAVLVGVRAEELVLAEAGVLAPGGQVLTLEELADRTAAEGVVIESAFTYAAPRTYALADQAARETVPAGEYRNYPAYAYATQVAVVEVDGATGRVDVLEIIAAHDCGRAINPQKIEGQIEGSCLMGQGYALSEEYKLERGHPITRTFGSLGLPTIEQAPRVRVLLIQDPEPDGPFGAKGISEVATVPATPAILNAIYDAVGVRITVLPATPDRIRRAWMIP
jgi:CO/xanthine dehydrogenase Mo-binding subunit